MGRGVTEHKRKKEGRGEGGEGTWMETSKQASGPVPAIVLEVAQGGGLSVSGYPLAQPHLQRLWSSLCLTPLTFLCLVYYVERVSCSSPVLN